MGYWFAYVIGKSRNIRFIHDYANASTHRMLDDLKASIPDDMPPLDQVNHLLPLTLPPEMAIFPLNGMKIGVREDGSGKFLRANRAKLREWLATCIPIQYDKRAIQVVETGKSVSVHFEDGSSATGDIIVGAEGAHSASTSMIHLVRL